MHDLVEKAKSAWGRFTNRVRHAFDALLLLVVVVFAVIVVTIFAMCDDQK